jgi:hypothetical protein
MMLGFDSFISLGTFLLQSWGLFNSLLVAEIAKELDVHGHGIPVTVANTTYMGMNALHAAGGHGKLPAYQYLVEEVKMDVNKPDTSQGNLPLFMLYSFVT